MAMTMQRFTQRPIVDTDPTYVMPAIGVGTDVLWYPDGNDKLEATYGHVTKVGNGTIEIMTRDFAPEWKQSVRHVSDPKLVNQQMKVWGGWDYTPQWLQFHELARKVDSVLAKFDEYDKRLDNAGAFDAKGVSKEISDQREALQEAQEAFKSNFRKLNIKVVQIQASLKRNKGEQPDDAEPTESEENNIVSEEG